MLLVHMMLTRIWQHILEVHNSCLHMQTVQLMSSDRSHNSRQFQFMGNCLEIKNRHSMDAITYTQGLDVTNAGVHLSGVCGQCHCGCGGGGVVMQKTAAVCPRISRLLLPNHAWRLVAPARRGMSYTANGSLW